jgi:hypothetical protein
MEEDATPHGALVYSRLGGRDVVLLVITPDRQKRFTAEHCADMK